VAKLFAKGATSELDPDLSSAEGKLAKAYKEGGVQFGQLVLTFKIAPKLPPNVKAEKPPVVEMTITLDVPIDGSSTKGTATMTANSANKVTFEQMGKKFTVDNTLKMNSKKEQSAEK